MPELPEVETIVQELRAAKLVGATIDRVNIIWPKIVDAGLHLEFAKNVLKQQVLEIHRRGKFIVLKLTDATLLIHLRMTGKLYITTSKETLRKHEHLQVHFSDGRILHYEDQRKFGRWYYSQDAKKLEELGLEPLSKEFTLKALKELLQSHSSQIKPFLLNQRFIAGIGNIYADEALWEAKIHPKTLTNTLSDNQMKQLHFAIRNVLTKGIENSGTSLGKHRGNYVSLSGKRGGNQNQLNVFRKSGMACPRCGNTIVKITVAQRGTHLCPHCQLLSPS